MIQDEEIKKRIIQLRSSGMTYGEINTALNLNISKSTLSGICKRVVLDVMAINRLQKLRLSKLQQNRIKALNANKVLLNMRLARLDSKAEEVLSDIDVNALKLALAMLYLGEGSKWTSYRGLSLGSSDEKILKLYLYMLEKCYGVSRSVIKARIQCRADQNAEHLKTFWSTELKLEKLQFYPTYIDRRTLGKQTKKVAYKGVCVLTCPSTEIQLELAAIANILHTKIKDTK